MSQPREQLLTAIGKVPKSMNKIVFCS